MAHKGRDVGKTTHNVDEDHTHCWWEHKTARSLKLELPLFRGGKHTPALWPSSSTSTPWLALDENRWTYKDCTRMFTDRRPHDYTPRNILEEWQVDICASVFVAALFTRAKRVNNPGVSRQMTGLTKCGAHPQCNAINPSKGAEFWCLYNMVELENIMLSEMNIVWDHAHQLSRIDKFIGTEGKVEVTRNCGEEKWKGFCLRWWQFFWK